MATTQKTEEQKRLDKLEDLVTKLIKTNGQLMKQADVHQRTIRRLNNKIDATDSKLNQLSRKSS